MANIPVRRSELNRQLTAFIAWLNEYGAEIGKPTNPYEVIRYRAYWRASRRAETHIIYAKENGLLTWTGATMTHFRSFIDGERPDGSMRVPAVKFTEPKTSKATIRREALLERDGDECWFCGRPMGDDCTIEHLVPKSKGGANHLDNYALAHRQCNADAADLPLIQKIEMRNRLSARIEREA